MIIAYELHVTEIKRFLGEGVIYYKYQRYCFLNCTVLYSYCTHSGEVVLNHSTVQLLYSEHFVRTMRWSNRVTHHVLRAQGSFQETTRLSRHRNILSTVRSTGTRVYSEYSIQAVTYVRTRTNNVFLRHESLQVRICSTSWSAAATFRLDPHRFLSDKTGHWSKVHHFASLSSIADQWSQLHACSESEKRLMQYLIERFSVSPKIGVFQRIVFKTRRSVFILQGMFS
jgi:hypothetical protein